MLKNRGYALQPEEERLKKSLEDLSRRVYDPDIVGRVNEIWARMTVVRERARQMGEEVGQPVMEWDEKQLKITSEVSVEHMGQLFLVFMLTSLPSFLSSS